MSVNISGTNILPKLKSRTFLLSLITLLIAGVHLFRGEPGENLEGLAMVVGAIAGYSVFSKREELKHECAVPEQANPNVNIDIDYGKE